MFETFSGNAGIEEEPISEKEVKREGSPERLMRMLKQYVEIGVKDIEVIGAKHLKDIPPDAKVVVVTTHISDMDLPIVACAVGEHLNVAITTDSFQHHLAQNPISKIGFKIADEENFLPIQYDKKTGHGQFDPENFDAMETQLDEGKAIVMAGHAPSIEKDPEKVAWHLPEKGTIGAIYLAELSGAVIVPVTVDMESEKPTGMGGNSIVRGVKNIISTVRNKVDARVTIGEPIILPHIDGIENFRDLMNAKPAEGRREEFRRIRTEMQELSGKIMEKFAADLPESKRGVWHEKLEHQGNAKIEKQEAV